MDTNFEDPILAFTLAFEGGKADDPRDPGGRTNQGVTQRTYTAHRIAAGEVDADVYAMTPAERTAIYRDGYWAAIGGPDLPAGVDLACFDFAVNSGPARARSALAKAGGAAMAAGDPAAMVKTICAARLSFLHALGTFKTFGRGWTARVAACEALGVRMALQARIGQTAAATPTRGTALILDREAKAAQGRADRHVAVARGTAVAGTAAAVAPAVLGTHHLVLVASALIAGAAGAATLALLWRAHQHAAKATAFATAARTR